MPNRVIKESINESSGLSTCSLFAQDLYKRLITYADDYGRFNADTMIMLARLYPREIYSISEQDILDGLIELAGVGKIGFYRPNVFNQYGKFGIYGAFPKWGEHQRLRDSRQKCPDPEDTSVNDWYLRRFIPMDLKRAVLERDKMKCSICGKYVTSCQDVTRFLKLGAGLYHIDHIVPVLQGGRATLENLRLTCPDCNLKRKKKFTFSEILEETINGCQSDVCGESRRGAESCSNPRPESESESESNPIRIQSESNPNPIQSVDFQEDDGLKRVCKAYEDSIGLMPRHVAAAAMSFIQAGIETDLVIRAIQLSAENNARTWSYVSAILRNCENKGITTLSAFEADSAAHKAQKAQPEKKSRWKDL